MLCLHAKRVEPLKLLARSFTVNTLQTLTKKTRSIILTEKEQQLKQKKANFSPWLLLFPPILRRWRRGRFSFLPCPTKKRAECVLSVLKETSYAAMDGEGRTRSHLALFSPTDKRAGLLSLKARERKEKKKNRQKGVLTLLHAIDFVMHLRCAQ